MTAVKLLLGDTRIIIMFLKEIKRCKKISLFITNSNTRTDTHTQKNRIRSVG